MAKISLFLIRACEGINLEQIPLASAQTQRANGLSGKRKLEYCLGRFLLRHALNKSGYPAHQIIEHDLAAPSLQLDHDEADPKTNDPLFSISHSKGWVGLAFCQSDEISQLGLDIEKTKSSLGERQASYFCNSRQLTAARSLDPAAASHYFTRLWTHKEAFCKSQGLSVLSSQAKAADFSRDARMQSALLNNSHHVSVYSDIELAIQTQFLQLGGHDRSNEAQESVLNWEPSVSVE